MPNKDSVAQTAVIVPGTDASGPLMSSDGSFCCPLLPLPFLYAGFTFMRCLGNRFSGGVEDLASMPGDTEATLFISNLDDRVDERLLYEIMVQAGPLVDVYMPRDKETKRHKGYGFAEYKSRKSANYALSLFTGLVNLYNRSVRFAISGGEKTSRDSVKTVGFSETTPRSNGSIGQHRSNELVHSNYPFTSPPVLDVHKGAGISMPRNILPLAYAHSYNSHLAVLGQRDLRAQPLSSGYRYAHQSY